MQTDYRSDEFLKKAYGENAIIIRLGHLNIIHLDNPSREEIHKRTLEIIKEELEDNAFFDDCPLCQEMKNHSYDIVYYNQDED